jgi:hypothetical protein
VSKQFDHEKAKEIANKIDPDKDYLDMVVDKIYKAPGKYPLYELMESLGTKFVDYAPGEAITILEAIYEALEKEWLFIQEHEKQLFIQESNLNPDFLNKDNLFNEAFYNMYQAAENCHKVELLAALDNCCIEE